MASEATFFTISVNHGPRVPAPGNSPYNAMRAYALAHADLPAGSLLTVHDCHPTAYRKDWTVRLKWNASKYGLRYPQFSDASEEVSDGA